MLINQIHLQSNKKMNIDIGLCVSMDQWFIILPSCLIDDVLPSPGDEAEFEFAGR